MRGKGEAYKIYLGPFFFSHVDTLGVRGWSCGDREVKNGWWGNTLLQDLLILLSPNEVIVYTL